MFGKKNWIWDFVLANIFAMSTIAIALFFQSLVPTNWQSVDVQKEVVKVSNRILNVVYILTPEKLSELYTCKPEKRQKDSKIQEFTYDEAQLLLKIAKAEGGDGVLGQAMCIRTIVNRIYDSNFPDNIYDILMQEGQFEVVTTGQYLLAEPNTNTHIALAMVESGWDETEGATYWEAITNTDHSWHKKHLVKIKEVEGNIFYHE